MIEIKNIQKSYKLGKTRVPILIGISLIIPNGEFISIMGPSGSGKTTLMNILGCLDNPDEGKYILDGEDISNLDNNKLCTIRNQKIGFIFQNYNLLSRTPAYRNVELPMIYGNITGQKERAKKALSIVGLGNKILNKPNELSGGEQQRVAIARALINNPSIILADEPTGNLDSETGKKIMAILKQLNQRGITIVLVTHDANVARYADRIIHIQDGMITHQENSPNKQGETDNQFSDENINESIDFFQEQIEHTRGISLRKISENVRMGINSIMSNKIRSSLTMLGVIIAIGSILTMVSIGHGAKQHIISELESLGINTLDLSKKQQSKIPITFDDILPIKEACPSTVKIAPQYTQFNQTAIYQNKNMKVTVLGTTPAYTDVRNFNVKIGRFFNDRDVAMYNTVVCIGCTVAKELFGDENPLGKKIRIKNINLEVIGIMKEKGASESFIFDRDKLILLPITTSHKRIFGVANREVRYLSILVKSRNNIEKARSEVTRLMRLRHRLKLGEDNDFKVVTMTDFISQAEESTKTFTVLLSIIASISLIVGGIGIMNIMLVSVTERTREIGLRKAIGSKRIDIITHFLVETIVICGIGGITGIATGIIASYIIGLKTQWITMVTGWAIILSLFFAFAIGVSSGLYPAYKASSLNPVEALRYE